MTERRESEKKIYVKVRADFTLDGRIVPLMLRPEDGPACRIDRILDVREAPSLKAGGQGLRYTCRVGERTLMLFYEEPYWFIEGESRCSQTEPDMR